MGKFDTHGGYFAPDNYIRVNEGGSHEENVNGGVQMGVDPEGVANLVEEDEVVYDDYVFSDNITTDEEMQEKHNLPRWAVGKLYSAVADKLVTEAEDRPNDPISNKGLEVMLGRLRDAQEEQKALKEQRDLEEELAQLSPEELDQLEQMLAEPQAMQGVHPGGDPVGSHGYMGAEDAMAAPAEQVPAGPMPTEGMPMMTSGGTLLRRFDIGGPLTDEEKQAIIDAGPIIGRRKRTMADEVKDAILAQDGTGRASGIGNTDYPLVGEHPELDAALAIAQPGTLLDKALAPSIYRGMVDGLANGEGAYALWGMPFKSVATASELANGVGSLWNKVRQYAPELEKLESDLANAKKARRALRSGKGTSTQISNADAEIKRLEYNLKSVRASYDDALRHARELNPVESVGKEVKSTSTSASEPAPAAEPAASATSTPAPQPATTGKPNRWRSAWQGAATGAAITGGMMLGDYLSNLGEDLKTSNGYYDVGDDLDILFAPADTAKTQPADTAKVHRNGGNLFQTGGPERRTFFPAPYAANINRYPPEYNPYFGVSDFNPYIGDDLAFELGESAAEGMNPDPPITPYTQEGYLEEMYEDWFPEGIGVESPGAAAVTSPVARIVSSPVVSANRNYIPYDPSINGEDFESMKFYRDFLDYMLANRDSEESAEWREFIQNEIKKLGSNYQLKDFDDWYRLALDGRVGPVHQATAKAARYFSRPEAINDRLTGLTARFGMLSDVNTPGADPNLVGPGKSESSFVPVLPLSLPSKGSLFNVNTTTGYRPENASLGLPEFKLDNPLQTTGVDAMDPLGRKKSKWETSVDGVEIGHPNPFASSAGDQSGSGGNGDDDKSVRSPYLSTMPRYAGATMAGLLGLYNAFQQPDRYNIPHYNPTLPQGQLHLTDPVYNPLDQEQAVNSVLASNAGMNRRIVNSGMGPSVGATLLASDYNAGQNMGAARQTVWDANNQRRNAIIAAKNQNAGTLANFDYGQSRDRAQILNDAAMRNMQNDLIRQRLNYESEGQKYAAIQSNLDTIAQALSGIGQENRTINAINSNNALYHLLSPNGIGAYKSWLEENSAEFGGEIERDRRQERKDRRAMKRILRETTPGKPEAERQKRRELQNKIDKFWAPPSPSEIERLMKSDKNKRKK